MRKLFNLSFDRIIFGSILMVTMVVFSSCQEDKELIVAPDFDRANLLNSLATELIIPNFETLRASVDDLFENVNSFVQHSTEENLSNLRSSWVQAARDHQHCSAFGFGPAELPLGPYGQVLGAFPVDRDQIEANMLNAGFDLANSFDSDVRGFYTIEYLIYGNGESDAEIVMNFDQNRKDYLLLVSDELQSTFESIVDEWNDSYRQEFTTNTGTSAGSPVSQLYNAFVKDYENLKNFKTELPAGLTADQSGPDGTLVEAYYSGISRELIVEHFECCKNVYFGRSRGGIELTGFDTYLRAVEGGSILVTQTVSAVEEIDEAISDLPQGKLSDHVDSPELVILRDKLQANTANFKSSMSSLIGVTITFNSGDGD